MKKINKGLNVEVFMSKSKLKNGYFSGFTYKKCMKPHFINPNEFSKNIKLEID